MAKEHQVNPPHPNVIFDKSKTQVDNAFSGLVKTERQRLLEVLDDWAEATLDDAGLTLKMSNFHHLGTRPNAFRLVLP